MTFAEGRSICNGKYEILRLIGEGGQSRVWLAREVKRGLEVAIKEPLPVLSSREREELQERFQRELRLSARIFQLDVPHTVRVLTVEEHEGQTVLVMEYCGGGSLAERLQRGPLPVEDAVRITLDVCAALEVVHSKLRLVHRDVKPSNILFASDGHARLGDSGLAQTGESGRSLFGGNRHPGTPGYMCPEQECTTGYLTGRCDLYTLGCVLFEMLTGVRYRDCSPGTPASSPRAEVPIWLDAVLSKVLQEDPWQRYASAGEMAAALKAGLGEWQQAEREVREKEDQERRAAVARARDEARRKADAEAGAQAQAQKKEEERLRKEAAARARAEGKARDEEERRRRWAKRRARLRELGRPLAQVPERLRALIGQKQPRRWMLPVAMVLAAAVLWLSYGPGARKGAWPTPTVLARFAETPTRLAGAAQMQTPTFTSTATSTGTATSTIAPTTTRTSTTTSTATQTVTATPTDTPTPAPPPVLHDAQVQRPCSRRSRSLGGITVEVTHSCSNIVKLHWEWPRPLQADEYFDVRVWMESQPHWGVAWTKEQSYEWRDAPPEQGRLALVSVNYYWSVLVLRHTGAKPDGTKEWEAVSEESEVRRFSVEPPETFVEVIY